MATARFNRGRWVADYYDAEKRRGIERPRGHFENLTDELGAAQALLADRVAEIADGLVHEGNGNLRGRGDSWRVSASAAVRAAPRSWEMGCWHNAV